MSRAIWQVIIDGKDISTILQPILTNLRISDKAGSSSDTASITLDDRNAQVLLPEKGASIDIWLGTMGDMIALTFRGSVDEVRSNGDRGGGRMVSISAKGFDSSTKVKERKQKHFDGKTIKEMLTDAGKEAGINDIQIDKDLGNIKREYEQMDDESFLAFGERLAGEVGGTFKISGKRAVFAKRNGGVAPNGQPLPIIQAVWGNNLISWDIAPFVGRQRYKETRSRYYDEKEAKWKEVKTQTAIEDAPDVTETSRFNASTKEEAEQNANSAKEESERESGEGRVVIEGNISAQPEANCIVIGARPGIDGTYRIDSVDHDVGRSGGFTTTLALGQPKDEAGKDERRKKKKKKGSGASDDEGRSEEVDWSDYQGDVDWSQLD